MITSIHAARPTLLAPTEDVEPNASIGAQYNPKELGVETLAGGHRVVSADIFDWAN